jgi:hypothetical protein
MGNCVLFVLAMPQQTRLCGSKIGDMSVTGRWIGARKTSPPAAGQHLPDGMRAPAVRLGLYSTAVCGS